MAVINDKLAESLFPGLDPIGKKIKIYGQPFEVVGLHAEAASLFSDASDPRLAIPHTTFTKVADYWHGWLQIAVVPTEAATVNEAQDQVTAALRTHRGLHPGQDNNFALVTQDRMLEAFNSVTAGFFVAMITLSSVGLMVGGIGVVAIMMISVTERTREIGVRKALGATRGEILFQFLVEAATLTLVGCLIGMALGAGWRGACAPLRPFRPRCRSVAVVAAVISSILTGVLFGLYPGRQGGAARSGGGVEVRVGGKRGKGERKQLARPLPLSPVPPSPFLSLPCPSSRLCGSRSRPSGPASCGRSSLCSASSCRWASWWSSSRSSRG